MAGIVHVPGSALTRVASDIVMSAGGPSVVPVMTKTFSATLVATELLLLELLGGSRANREVEDLRAADAADDAIAAADPLVVSVAATLVDARHLFVTGGGVAYPAALEAALKLKEIARRRGGRRGLGDDVGRRDDARTGRRRHRHRPRWRGQAGGRRAAGPCERVGRPHDRGRTGADRRVLDPAAAS